MAAVPCRRLLELDAKAIACGEELEERCDEIVETLRRARCKEVARGERFVVFVAERWAGLATFADFVDECGEASRLVLLYTLNPCETEELCMKVARKLTQAAPRAVEETGRIAVKLEDELRNVPCEDEE